MWRTEEREGDIYPPPAMGRHGMVKNRFLHFESLQAQMFDKDETELDPTDPWRYSRAVINSYNQRRESLIIPSWILVGDESMSAYTGAEGVLDGVGVMVRQEGPRGPAVSVLGVVDA